MESGGGHPDLPDPGRDLLMVLYVSPDFSDLLRPEEINTTGL